MTNSIVDLTSQRLKKLKLFIEHIKTHPVYLESSLHLEREAVYKPLSPEIKAVVNQAISKNVIHMYSEDFLSALKLNLTQYLNIDTFNHQNLFIASNLYNFYEYLTELFLQKDQKVLLYTADDYSFEQEARFINSGRIIIEDTRSPVGCLDDIISELSKDDYKIVIICAQDLDPKKLIDIVDLLPENVVLVLRSTNPVAFNYINHGNKTVIVVREFPNAMTLVEPPISFAIARKEVVKLLNDLQLPNNLDIITLFAAKYFTSLDNPQAIKVKPPIRSSEGYQDILLNIVRENIEAIKPKEEEYTRFEVAHRLKNPLGDIVDYANGIHFLGIPEDLKTSLPELIDSQDRYNYYSQRTLLRNMIAQNISRAHKKFHYNNILLGAGVSGLLETITRAFINDGEGYKKLYKEKALILGMSSDNYTRVIQKRDAQVEYVDLALGLDVDVSVVISRIKQCRPKIIIIDNPRIIAGSYFDRNQLKLILDNISDQSIAIIDETFYQFAAHENDHFTPATELIDDYPNLIVLRSFSTLYALAGMRIGYAVAQEHIINCMDSIRHPFDVSPFALHFGIKTLQSTEIFEKVTLKYVQEQKEAIYQYFSEMGLFYIKSYTNSILFSTPLDARELQERLLPYKILIKPLEKNFVRFSINDQNRNIYFIKCLKMTLGSQLHN